MIRVGIADDHSLVRQGIRSLLEKASDVAVIGEPADGQAAVELCERSPSILDVLVMDIGMPRLSGIQATQAIRARHLLTRVIMLSMHTDNQLVLQALRAGANGYVLKSALFEDLLTAIRLATDGNFYLSPEISESVIDEVVIGSHAPQEKDMGRYARLSLREREILKLLVEGYTNSEMAAILNISIRTVQKHRGNVMEKLDVHDVAGLTRLAIRHGLIFMED